MFFKGFLVRFFEFWGKIHWYAPCFRTYHFTPYRLRP